MTGDIFNLRRLRYFVAIAAAGSLSAAARKLNVAQPALSHQMAELERCMGRPVLTRTSRGVALTPAGTLLLKHAEIILRDVADANAALNSLGCEGPFPEVVKLSLTPSIYDITSSVVTQFNEEFPATRVTVSEDRFDYCYDLIHTGKLDLAVTLDDPTWPGAIGLAWESLFLVSLNLRADRDSSTIKFSDFAQEKNLIVPGVGGPMRTMLDDIAQQQGIVLKVAQELRGVAARKQAVLAGLGSAVLPWRSVAREARAGVVRAQRIVDPPLRRQLVMRFRAGMHPGFLDRCCTMMRRILDEVEEQAPQVPDNRP